MLVLLIGILLGVILFYLLLKLKPTKYISQEPLFASAEAEHFLENNGFKIIDKQKASPTIVYINGKSHLCSTVADYIVEKENRKFAVKVETSQIVDPLDPVIYRKLIEFQNTYPNHGILLFDLHNKELNEIKITFPKPDQDIFFKFLISLFVILAVMGIIFLFSQLKLV